LTVSARFEPAQGGAGGGLDPGILSGDEAIEQRCLVGATQSSQGGYGGHAEGRGGGALGQRDRGRENVFDSQFGADLQGGEAGNVVGG
jgi:hypothetical protein